MLRVKQGDDKAFAELITEFQDRVTGILFHMVGNADEAEDLAQEVFLRVYRSRASYEPTAKFSTWLFTIVNNLARNAVRDRKRRRDRIGTVHPASNSEGVTIDRVAVAPSGAMPSRIFARQEMAELVRAAVAQLSEDQRLAMMLHRFEHMNYKQISEVMDKSEAAVKSLLARARVVLRDILEPFVQPGASDRLATDTDSSEEE
jgi:RNA polymerase sigma-70 factor (ECF subfamily)